MIAAFSQSITSEKGSSQPLLRMTGIQAACEETEERKDRCEEGVTLLETIFEQKIQDGWSF